ncbi:unnamed protein product [Closterium sp. Naga37s-1]|nr:unnamed protein product [Closterium sp. Naga37s-1]
MAKRSGRARDSRLLALPDELLNIILGLADHPSDRRNVALSCSRLRRLSRRTPHALRLELLTSLELNPLYESSRLFTGDSPDVPVHLFPSLQSLTLHYDPDNCRPVLRCSSLTSLTLWDLDSSTLSSLASPESSLRATLKSLTIHSAELQGSLAPLAVFSALTSLSFHSCTIDPGVRGTETGREAGAEAKGDGGVADASKKAHAGASAAARVFPRGGDKQWEKFVDIRREAEAALQERLVAAKDVVQLSKTALEATKEARSFAQWAEGVQGASAMPEISLGKFRLAISTCRAFIAGIRKAKAAIKWEEALLRAFAAAAAAAGGGGGSNMATTDDLPAAAAAAHQAPGFFATELDFEEEDRDGEDTDEGDGTSGMDYMLPGDGLPGSVLGGVRSGVVETREALGRLKAQLHELWDLPNSMLESYNSMLSRISAFNPTLARPVADAAAAGGGAATPGGGSGATPGAAAARGGAAVRGGRAAVRGGRAAVQRVKEGATEASQRVESMLGEAAAGGAEVGKAAAGKTAAGETAAGETAAGNAAAGNAAAGDAKLSSRKSSFKHSEGCLAAVPVQVYCPPLGSLTLQSLSFASTPHSPMLPPTLFSSRSGGGKQTGNPH